MEKLFTHHNSLDSQRGGLSSYNVALLYENGIGQLKPDLGVAVRYYEKAAIEHVRDAYANLAQILISGSAETYGVSRDVTRGLELLARGVELGSRECAYNLGCLYKAGKDVAVDDRKAAYYLGIAYLARHEHAHRLLILLQQTSKLDFSAEIAAAKRQINEWELIRLSQSDNH